MAILARFLLGMLAGDALIALVGRLLIALGISYVTYKGVNVGTDQIVQMMQTSFGSIGGEVGSFLQWLWVDKALSMIVSAFAASLAIRTTAGAITKMVFKK